MDAPLQDRGSRGRGFPDKRGGHHRNKQWVAGDRSAASSSHHSDGERWERGRGISGRGRGQKRFPNQTLRSSHATDSAGEESVDDDDDMGMGVEVADEDPILESAEEREKFYQELVKAREQERKQAIAEGKMDDPLVPKRLEDAITMVGTCTDMCPRFERYRRERENNLFEWELIPGTKRVDHRRAVKMYERAAGDKTLPSDLRPPHVLKGTLDYLFHDLMDSEGFSRTFNFVRDRTRAVRNDFTMQHETGPLAIECHDRCARFHILALHIERDRQGFSLALEEQQLMNTLQSLKEFYEDQRGRYDSPTELEMRVYHRLIHIRDQRERHEEVPDWIRSHPVFKLTTEFRLHVQKKSAPITKTSQLLVDNEGLEIFGKLAQVLKEEGSVVMIYLVACILERHFGKGTIEDIESIKGDLTLPEIIDGGPFDDGHEEQDDYGEEDGPEIEEIGTPEAIHLSTTEPEHPSQPKPAPVPASKSAFAGLVSTNAFGASAFGTSAFGQPVSTPPAATASAFPSTSTPMSTQINGFGQKPASVAPSTSSSTPNFFSSSSFLQQSQPQSTTGAPSPFGQPFSFDKPPTSQPTPSQLPQPSFPSFSSPAGRSQPSSFQPQPQFHSPKSNLDPTAPTFTPSNSSAASSSAFASPAPPKEAPSPAPQPLFQPSTPERPSFTPFSTPPPQLPLAQPPQDAPKSSPLSFPSKPSVFSAPPGVSTPWSTQAQVGSQASATPSPIPTPPASAPVAKEPRRGFFSAVSPPPSQPASRSSLTPPLHRIDTSVGGPAPTTPTAPPPPPRIQPISLPGTPTLPVPSTPAPSTVAAASSASKELGPQKSIPNFLKNNILTSFPTAAGSTESGMLSPLVFGTPSGSTENLASPIVASSTRKQSLLFSEPPVPVESPDTKAKKVKLRDQLEAKLKSFESKISRVYLDRWKKRFESAVEWEEAVRKSEEYKNKLRASPPKRKRTVSRIVDVTPQQDDDKKKRQRRRREYEVAPQTDEELARRFKENHEEQERRWAPGSLLRVIQNSIRCPWQVWLSMNPESDATAIWMQNKFDVPASGDWLSESVFAISLRVGALFPGLIVFECTPWDGVEDELERKYRVLDDCSRLRDIVKALPPRSYYVPSLVLCRWEEKESPVPDDLAVMVNKMVSEKTLTSFSLFTISTTVRDLDAKFSEAIMSLELDTDGMLARSLTLRGVFGLFEGELKTFVDEWIEHCLNRGDFNWTLYTRLIYSVVALLNAAVQNVATLVSANISYRIPEPRLSTMDDSDSAYESAMVWLSAFLPDNDIEAMAMDLQAHHNVNSSFPCRIFIDHLHELVRLKAEDELGYPPQRYHVLNDDIASVSHNYDALIQGERAKLIQVMSFSARRSPSKRRSVSQDTTSEANKRPRITPLSSRASTPTTPHVNGRRSPSPSASILSESAVSTPDSSVSVAMLRALTKDLRQKYVIGS